MIDYLKQKVLLYMWAVPSAGTPDKDIEEGADFIFTCLPTLLLANLSAALLWHSFADSSTNFFGLPI